MNTSRVFNKRDISPNFSKSIGNLRETLKMIKSNKSIIDTTFLSPRGSGNNIISPREIIKSPQFSSKPLFKQYQSNNNFKVLHKN